MWRSSEILSRVRVTKMANQRTTSQLDLVDYVAILRRRWKAILFMLSLTAIAAVVATTLTEDRYTARSEVLLRTASTSQLFPSATDTANRLFRQTQAELTYLGTAAFRSAAFGEAGVAAGDVDVSIEIVSTEETRDTGVIRFEVEAASPQDAAATANAFVESYIELRNQIDIEDIDRQLSDEADNLAALELELMALREPLDTLDTQIASTTDAAVLATLATRQNQLLIQLGGDIAQLESEITQSETLVDSLSEAAVVIRDPSMTAINVLVAAPPSSPSSAGLGTNLPIALAVGLLLGMGTALLLESLDSRVHDHDEISELLDLPVLTRIADQQSKWGRKSTATFDPQGSEFEAFRSLRSSLMLRAPTGELGILQITSATQGNGKSTVTRQLAHAFAQQGETVLVIDGDLRRPTMHRQFSVATSPGLSDVLRHSLDLNEVVVRDVETSVFVLPSGELPPNPSELLGGEGMERLCKQARVYFDVVIIDSPPLLPVPDARLIAANSGAVVLVADPQKNSRRELLESQRLLEETDTKVLGLVINRVNDPKGAYSYGGYK